MRTLTKECDSPSTQVAEQWLTTLVDAIKKEDQAVAEREYLSTRRAELIAQNGPVYWRKFTDVLEVLLVQMEGLFGDHVTKGKISFTRSPYGGGISINKSAYPFVTFSATPNFSETAAHFTYTVVNPEVPQNTGVPGRYLPCRFGVENEGIVMSLDGTLFETPESAAKFIVEKLFTVATSEVSPEVGEPAWAAQPCEMDPPSLSGYSWPPVRSRPVAFSLVDEVVPVCEAAGPPPLPAPVAPVAPVAIPSYASRFLASASRILIGGGPKVAEVAVVAVEAVPVVEVVELAVEVAPVVDDAENVAPVVVEERVEETRLIAASARRRVGRHVGRQVRLSYHDQFHLSRMPPRSRRGSPMVGVGVKPV